ncbi:MAG: PIG-L deacetylase family protein [Candidatus Heimdallarchaeaceae archaeon]
MINRNEMRKNYQVLFVEPHQDDIICIAGTVIKLKRTGCQIKYICTTDSRYDSLVDEPTMPEDVAKRLDAVAKECCQLLGIDKFFNLSYEDGFYTYNEKTVKEMTALIREYKPDIVFTVWPQDNHPDHANTAKVVERSIDLANYPFYRGGKNFVTDCKVLSLYFHQAGVGQTVNFVPDLHVDVSEMMDKIEEAIKKFTTPKTTEGFIKAETIRRKYEAMKGKEYVESLAKSRKVGIQSWSEDPLIKISQQVNFPFLIK